MIYLASRGARFGEPGASIAKTQSEGALVPFVRWWWGDVTGKDAASGVTWPLKREQTRQMGHRGA